MVASGAGEVKLDAAHDTLLESYYYKAAWTHRTVFSAIVSLLVFLLSNQQSCLSLLLFNLYRVSFAAFGRWKYNCQMLHWVAASGSVPRW